MHGEPATDAVRLRATGGKCRALRSSAHCSHSAERHVYGRPAGGRAVAGHGEPATDAARFLAGGRGAPSAARPGLARAEWRPLPLVPIEQDHSECLVLLSLAEVRCIGGQLRNQSEQ